MGLFWRVICFEKCIVLASYSDLNVDNSKIVFGYIVVERVGTYSGRLLFTLKVVSCYRIIRIEVLMISNFIISSQLPFEGILQRFS